MKEHEAKKTLCPKMSGPVATFDGLSFYYNFTRIACFGSECQWWVEDEWVKEQIAGQPGHYNNFPCGHCGAMR